MKKKEPKSESSSSSAAPRGAKVVKASSSAKTPGANKRRRDSSPFVRPKRKKPKKTSAQGCNKSRGRQPPVPREAPQANGQASDPPSTEDLRGPPVAENGTAATNGDAGSAAIQGGSQIGQASAKEALAVIQPRALENQLVQELSESVRAAADAAAGTSISSSYEAPNEHQADITPVASESASRGEQQAGGGSKQNRGTAADASRAVQTPLEALRKVLKAHEAAKKYLVAAICQAKSSADVSVCVGFLRTLPPEAVSAILNRTYASVEALASGGLLRKALGIMAEEQISAILLSPLMQVALKGSEDVVISLLKDFSQFLDLGLQGSILLNDGAPSRTIDLLTVAVLKGAADLIDLLLRQGCVPDLGIQVAMRLNAVDELIVMVNALPNFGNDNKNLPSSLTLEDMLIDLVATRTQHPNSLTLLQLLVQRGGIVTQAVMRAALRGCNHEITQWASEQIDPTSLGSLFLQFLNAGDPEKHLPQVEKLLELNKNCHTAKYNDDRSALMATAAAAYKLPFLKAILGKISDPPFVNERHPVNGRTALHYAAEYRCLDAAAALLKAKANPNIADSAGKTPIELALEATSARSLQEDVDFSKKLVRLCMQFPANFAN